MILSAPGPLPEVEREALDAPLFELWDAVSVGLDPDPIPRPDDNDFPFSPRGCRVARAVCALVRQRAKMAPDQRLSDIWHVERKWLVDCPAARELQSYADALHTGVANFLIFEQSRVPLWDPNRYCREWMYRWAWHGDLFDDEWRDPFDVNVWRLNPNANPPELMFEILCADQGKFLATFERRRRDLNNDDSRFDASLAAFAFGAGWVGQEVVDLIIASRRDFGIKPEAITKALRRDYIDRTCIHAILLVASRLNRGAVAA